MFDTVFIENQLKNKAKTQEILKNSKYKRIQYIDNYQQYFGKSFKPYLHKRSNLNLFIASKKGQLVKEAPNAYGLGNSRHYYFIHSYNCIYECQYCYLQGYFKSPDLVFFTNHQEILQEMETKILQENSNQVVWFHAGEFSDSLALNHISQEWSEYWPLFKKYPNVILELRTKSTNTRKLLQLEPIPNCVVSFSLSPNTASKKFDLKTPSTLQRIKAMQKLSGQGFKLAVHLDPVIFKENFEKEYSQLLLQLQNNIPFNQLAYLSLGVVRFTPEVYRHVQKNYPESDIFHNDLIKTDNNLLRYSKSLRLFILKKLKKLSMNLGLEEEKIYFCME